MAKTPSVPGISATLVSILERARPFDDDKGKPLSDNAWCDRAKVNPGFWRDLRKGTEPGLDKVQRIARVAGLSLADIEAGGRAVDLPTVSELERALIETLPGMPKGGPDKRARYLAENVAQILKLPESRQATGPRDQRPDSAKGAPLP